MSAAIVAAVVGAAGVGYSIYSSEHAKSKAKKELMKQNNTSFDVDPAYQANQALAASRAQQGYSQKTLDFYKAQTERQLSAANQATLDIGGGVNDVNRNYETALRSIGDFSAKSEALQSDNLKQLMDNNVALAGQNTMKWAVGYKQWLDANTKYNNATNAANQNIANGLANLGQSFSNAYNSYNSNGSSGNNNTSNYALEKEWQSNYGNDYNPNKGLN